MIMASDLPGIYTHDDYLADQKYQEQKKISEWLKKYPEIGVLNSGKYYVVTDDFEIEYIEPLTELEVDD